MKKPIFRWTIGNTSKIGYECLEYSINSVLNLYGDAFEYYVLYNNSKSKTLQNILQNKPVSLVEQNWNSCPISIDITKNKLTALWKVCPARFDINRHEIIMDNDIILLKKPIEVEEFLSSSKKIIITEDPIKFQGQFSHLFANKNYNSGFIGLPPGYDFAKDIYEIWKNNNSPEFIGNGDEQGLTTAALCLQDHIFISKEKFVLIHDQGITDEVNNYNIYYKKIDNFFTNEYYSKMNAYHFVGCNRKKEHQQWTLFKNQYDKIKNKIKII